MTYNKHIVNPFIFGSFLLLLFTLVPAYAIAQQVREKILINDSWRFMRYTANADNLIIPRYRCIIS